LFAPVAGVEPALRKLAAPRQDAVAALAGTSYLPPPAMLLDFFRPRRQQAPAARLPEGMRVYAIGDVHGRRDLLDRLLARIDEDAAARGPATDTRLVLLGDLIDRGPESAAVVERVLELGAARAGVHLLGGNHEEMLLAALDGDDRVVRAFCRAGGRETLLSYGLDAAAYDSMDYEEIAAVMPALVPALHQAVLADAETLLVLGDYAFAHAGVRPGVALAEQSVRDLRWIRDPFLGHRGTLEKVVVHGHTVRPEVEFRQHRIGIDTGAWHTGRLTALGLEGAERWILQTEDPAAPAT
jgi:serine/threonine protein phosphatase 1